MCYTTFLCVIYQQLFQEVEFFVLSDSQLNIFFIHISHQLYTSFSILTFICVFYSFAKILHYKSDWHRFNLKQKLKGEYFFSKDKFMEVTGNTKFNKNKTVECSSLIQLCLLKYPFTETAD